MSTAKLQNHKPHANFHLKIESNKNKQHHINRNENHARSKLKEAASGVKTNEKEEENFVSITTGSSIRRLNSFSWQCRDKQILLFLRVSPAV